MLRAWGVQLDPAWVASAVIVAALLSIQVAVHRDVGGWNAKGAPQDVSTLDGHLVEWEWEHMGSMARLLEAQAPTSSHATTQDLYRYVGPYLMALLRPPGSGIYYAAVAATVIAWGAAAMAAGYLGRLVGGAGGGIGAAALTATNPAFTAYLGNVDPHPFGYAAAACWLALAEGTGAFESAPWERAWRRLVGLGLALCLGGLMMEVAYPLLGIAWAFYGLRGLVARRPVAVAVRLALMTAVFGVTFFGFRWVAEHMLFEEVAAFNEPFSALWGSLRVLASDGAANWLASRAADFSYKWPAMFPVPVSAFMLIGALFAGTRWLVWAAMTIGVVVVAVTLVKPAMRDLSLCFPAVYVLAALGADRLGLLAASKVRSLEGVARVLRIGVPVLAVGAAAVVTNADLWGDYWLPYAWFTLQ